MIVSFAKTAVFAQTMQGPRRLAIEYEPHYDRFRVRERKFSQQYAGVYFCRLQQLQSVIQKEAQRRWGHKNIPIVMRILNLQSAQDCIIYGTFYKEMVLKPSILEEYTREEHVLSAVPVTSFVSDSDFAILEDTSGRVRLTGNFPIKELVTGMIVAFRGHELPSGEFEVKEYCLPGVAPQKPLQQARGYVALVSGLRFGAAVSHRAQLELLASYLAGEMGSAEEQQQYVSSIVRVVVAGNSLAGPKDQAPSAFKNMLSFRFAEPNTAAVAEADEFFARVAQTVPVDLMAGPEDPANHMMPQQPFVPCLFPRASQWSSFRSVTNPYDFSLGGVRVLGSSGQPIEDMAKYITLTDKLQMMRLSLTARHMAPTAPDTLESYPFYQSDPFVMEQAPHIYFTGNQQEFASETVEVAGGGVVRSVLLPSFAETGTIVLVDLATLECHPITFVGY